MFLGYLWQMLPSIIGSKIQMVRLCLVTFSTCTKMIQNLIKSKISDWKLVKFLQLNQI